MAWYGADIEMMETDGDCDMLAIETLMHSAILTAMMNNVPFTRLMVTRGGWFVPAPC